MSAVSNYLADEAAKEAALVDLADRIAAHLDGGPWEVRTWSQHHVRPDEPSRPNAGIVFLVSAEIAPAEITITNSDRAGGPSAGRLEVSSFVALLAARVDLGKLCRHSCTVAEDRPAEAIARDINRKVIGPCMADIPAVAERRAERAAEQEAGAEMLRACVLANGGEDPERFRRMSDELRAGRGVTLHLNTASGYGRAELSNSDRIGPRLDRIDLRGVPASKAPRVLAAIREALKD